jgi:serine beta-lactamase-like protein LACTB
LDTKNLVIPSKTKFEIASITKTVTAAVLAKLYEEHLIDFNKSAYLYLDSLPKKKL